MMVFENQLELAKSGRSFPLQAPRKTWLGSVARLMALLFVPYFLLTVVKTPSWQDASMISHIASSKTNSTTTTVRGCLMHWYGPLNYKAMEAWIKYHRVRWGLTVVDIYLPDRRIDEARLIFGGAYEGVHVQIFRNTLREDEARESKQLLLNRQVWIFNQSLKNARRAKNDFFINFDADEFLISDDFSTLSEMFSYANHGVVSIPVFQNHYHICSSNELTFGSTTYQSLMPHGANFVDDAGLEYYDEPPRSCYGNSKYIVMPTSSINILESPHDPYGCAEQNDTKHPPFSETTYYMSGRKTDGEHVRVNHMRTGLGIFADMTMSACVNIPTCKYVNWDGNCVSSVKDAIFENQPSTMNSILADFPLFTNTSEFMTNALCYARRYPDLFQGFCNGDSSQCLYGSLWKHYLEYGKSYNMIWNCRV